MTRFARAKGSKASNERLPEEATSWHEMKQLMLNKNKESADDVARQANDQRKMETYRTFLEEKQQNDGAQWAEFPVKSPNTPKIKILSQQIIKLEDDAPLEVSSKIHKIQTKKTQKKKLKSNINHAKKIRSEAMSSDKKFGSLTGIDQDKVSKGGKSVLNSIKKQGKLAMRVEKKNGAKGPKVEQRAKENLNPPEKELTEEDLKKIEKKNQRRLRQIMKRKEMKDKLKEQGTPAVNDTPKPIKIPVGSKAKTAHKVILNNPQKKEKVIKSKVKGPRNKDFKRKKPLQSNQIMVNGKTLTLSYFQGFPIKIEDAVRLKALKKDMISKGLPRSQIDVALKLERRRAEKALSREKKMVCFHCRKAGHNLSECPEVSKDQTEKFGTGICFKCGSTEHTHFQCKVVKGQEYKFATCFICKEQGHISRQCPDNARGLYPKGGACKVCGDVTHLKKDCPQHQAQQQSTSDIYKVETLNNSNPDVMETKDEKTHNARKTPQKKIIKLA